jgi:hypothetical protein
MKEIHLIERIQRLRKVPGADGEWDSGYWTVSKYTAEQLVGGAIYLHTAQDARSHFGGIILGYAVVPADQEFCGKIVFRFRRAEEQIGVISRGGWGMEKKLVGIEA